MKITVARTAGPCFGVQRALELAQQSAALGPTCTLGELIHNRQAVQQLAESGITVIASPEEAPAGAAVVLRSHPGLCRCHGTGKRSVRRAISRSNPRLFGGADHLFAVGMGENNNFRKKSVYKSKSI